MLLAYTYGGKKSKGRALTLLAYTCGGQKSKGRALTLLACTCGGQGTRLNAARMHLRWAKVYGTRLNAARMHLWWARDAPQRCSHTPAAGKSFWCGPLHSLGYIIMLCCDLEHLFVGPNSLEILKTGQKTHFSAFRAL